LPAVGGQQAAANRNGKLSGGADWAEANGVSKGSVLRLLGQPDGESQGKLIYFCHAAWDGSGTSFASPATAYVCIMENDRVISFGEVGRWAVP
jgi:hypothetical protein